MGLPDKSIKEFKEIYMRVIKEEITDEKASEYAECLMVLFRLAYQSAKKRVLEENIERELLSDVKL